MSKTTSKIYTTKQQEFMGMWQRSELKRLNILEGSVRSGKTWISLVLWAFWVSQMPKDKSFLMVAKTLTSLRRNTLDLLQALVGTSNFTYSLPAKEARLFGRLIYLEGVNDARAESKIRGMTLQGAYCDEITLFTEDFFAMLLSRLSEKGAKLIGTTNPDAPSHWLKENYLDRHDELDMLVMKFLIDDNEFLDPEYVKQLKAEYTGVFYNRFILGEWVRAEGIIYPQFNDVNITDGGHIFTDEQAPKGNEYALSLDYGTSNATNAGLWRIVSGVGWMLKEYHHDGRKSGQLTDEEHMNNIIKMVQSVPGAYPTTQVIVDPSAASLITCFRRHGGLQTLSADNTVIDGIRNCGSALLNRRAFFNQSCKNTIREIQNYAWDDSTEEERPLKVDDHGADQFRYFVRTYLKRYYKDFV